MKKVYLIFYETRHSGNAIKFTSKDNAEKWAREDYEDEGLAIPCLATYNSKIEVLYYDDLRELDPTKVNEIEFSETPIQDGIKIKTCLC